MFSDKAFSIALTLSLITHGVIFFQSNKLNLNIFPKKENEPLLELSYVKVAKNDPVLEERVKAVPDRSEPLLRLSSKIANAKVTPPPAINKEGIFNKNGEDISLKDFFVKPVFVKPDIISVKKKISLPPIDLDKIDNPLYISYYQIVREKIRRAAYQNYTRTETGEVYLSFLISQDGSLKTIKFIEEKSSPSSYLNQTALKSIKDASPFPSFPKELDYPQLSFNVVISFEVE
ncbi:MAG: energy transducer TonB [Candidatus Omnitrophota bacterium]